MDNPDFLLENWLLWLSFGKSATKGYDTLEENAFIRKVK